MQGKYGGGSGTFSMRIFLTQRKLLLQQLSNLFILPDAYEEIGRDFIINEHPFGLNNISTVIKHINNTVYKNIIGKIIDEKYYDIEQRRITLEDLKKSVILNIQANDYELDDFEIIDTATTEIYTLSLHDALPILIYFITVEILFKPNRCSFIIKFLPISS